MPKLPEKKEQSFWLFSDSIPPQGAVLQFVEFVPEYLAKNGKKKLPVFVLLGSVEYTDKETKKLVQLDGELLVSLWNLDVSVVEKLLGDNTDTWGTPFFRIVKNEKKPDRMVVSELVETKTP